MRKEKMAKKTGVAPEHAGNRGMEGGPVMDTVASTDQGQGTLHPLSWPAYNSILKYFNKRMGTQGVEALDTHIAKLTELLYAKRKVPVRFAELQLKFNARLIEARQAYAEQNCLGLANVTTQVLEESEEGVQHWLNQVKPSPSDNATEHVIRVLDPEDSAMRISSVLYDRDEWLSARGLDCAIVMDRKQRCEFLAWSIGKFAEDRSKRIPEDSDRCTRIPEVFVQEQERRLGAYEIWELLAYNGLPSVDAVGLAFKDNKETETAAKRAATTTSPPRPSASKRLMLARGGVPWYRLWGTDGATTQQHTTESPSGTEE